MTTHPTKCNDIDNLVQAYLDSELEDRELHDFESHIGECSDCASLLGAEEQFRTGLRECLVPPPASDMLRQRVIASLDKVDAEQRRAQRQASWGWALPGASVLVAAAALVLFVADSMQSATAEPPAVAATTDTRPVRGVMTVVPTPVVLGGTDSEISHRAREYTGVQLTIPQFSGVRSTLRGWSRSEFSGRQAARFLYDVNTGQSQHVVTVDVLDAREVRLSNLDRMAVGELVKLELRDGCAVMFRDERGIGYVFSSDMSPELLVGLVRNSGLRGIGTTRESP